ncbi:MAG: hypothetical protein HOJ79_08795 [Nitrospina sp.]|jgi:hypothetical protein|nr:hypothetical protein [Nitrospina sp.]
MDSKVNLTGGVLWSLVVIVVVLTYTGVKYASHEKLKDLCVKYQNDPQSLPSSELDHTLSELNDLRLSNDAENSQWIESCTGLVMVEMKSRKFAKKLQKPRLDIAKEK